jgi:heme/copper-type cytochrome/quinol oxidase subunit 2
MTDTHRSWTVASACLAAVVVSLSGAQYPPSPSSSPTKEFTITARREAYTPARIEVVRGDLVKITLVAEDEPHTFTIDSYRISKRAAPGRNATIEFHAEITGRHPYYCSLTADNCCRHMRGELVVLAPH